MSSISTIYHTQTGIPSMVQGY